MNPVGPGWWLGLTVVLAVVLGVGTPVILRRLPAPVDAPLGWSYMTASGPRIVPLVSGLAVVALSLACWLVWASALAAWVVLGTFGILLGVIDAQTGFLPRRLCHVALALAGVAVTVSALVWRDWTWLAQAAVSCAVTGGIMWLIWRSTPGLGFGDVRLAALIGLVAGTGGLMSALWSLAVSAILAAGAGILRQLSGSRSRSYPYGPFLVAGPYLVCVLQYAIAI